MSGLSIIKDVLCPLLLRIPLLCMLFYRHVHAMSYINRAHKVKPLTKYSADSHSLAVRIFLLMHGDPHFFFGRSLPFLIVSIIKRFLTWEVLINY